MNVALQAFALKSALMFKCKLKHKHNLVLVAKNCFKAPSKHFKKCA